MEDRKTTETKKLWESPALTVYGDMTALTQQTKVKQPGFRDDFNVTGISNP